jgi:small subunit ribosomal protein S4
MKTKPKYKLCRSLGENIFEKCQTPKFQLAKGRKKGGIKKFTRPKSEYGKQLVEKQKVRFAYGITERQLSNYVKKSKNAKDIVNALFSALEFRLDNVVYRLGFAKTRAFARQMVGHGHIMVNGKRVTIPSYRVLSSDVISIRPESIKKSMFANLKEREKDSSVPEWLLLDTKSDSGTVRGVPETEKNELSLDFRSIIEFYSRV